MQRIALLQVGSRATTTRLLLLLLLFALSLLVAEASVTQQSAFTPEAAASYDLFGASVDLSSSFAFVSAPDRSVGSAERQGAVQIFQRSEALWAATSLLTAQDGQAFDGFGHIVCLTELRAAVGAPHHDGGSPPLQDSGAVFVYTLSAGSWGLSTKLLASDAASNDGFGSSLALNDEMLLVSAPQKNVGYLRGVGAVYVFSLGGSAVWSQVDTLSPVDVLPGDFFGVSVALGGASSTTFAVGACGQGDYGVVYIFTRQSTVGMHLFSQQQKVIPAGVSKGGRFGSSLAMSGSYILVGSPLDTVNAKSQAGSVSVYTLNGSVWSLQQILAAPDAASGDNFGVSVSLSPGTAIALIGSKYADIGSQTNQGASYLFTRTHSTWQMDSKVTSNNGESNDEFSSVALTEYHALVGAPRKTLSGVSTLTNAGSAYAFSVSVSQQGVTSTFSNSQSPSSSNSQSPSSSNSQSPSSSNSQSLSFSNSQSLSFSNSQSPSSSNSQSSLSSDTQSQTRSAAIMSVYADNKSKSEHLGYQVAVRHGIAIISVPVCVNPSTEKTCDGGHFLIYKKNPTGWILHRKVRSPFRNRDNKFGWTMELNDNYLIVSSPDSKFRSVEVGSVVFYTWSTIADSFVKDSVINFRKMNPKYNFGSSMSNFVNTTVVGMPEYDASSDAENSGGVHVYKKIEDKRWGKRVTITAQSPVTNGKFGHSVSMHGSLRFAASNFPYDGSAHAVFIFDYSSSKWSLRQTISSGGKLGFGWRIRFFEGVLYVSAIDDSVDESYAGSISTYELSQGGEYTYNSDIKPNDIVPGKHFGYSFSQSEDGSRLVVGANPCQQGQSCGIKGSIYIFTRDDNGWIECYSADSPVLDGSDGFGFDVAIENRTVMVSAPFNGDNARSGVTYFIEK